ncbi:MAG TPA: DUF3999 family protein [Acidobacteriaceae bacterium]|nr:DUF3999 family protein [Acidobacteriaceae bacterium]
MKAAALLALLVLNGASTDTNHFRFERSIVGIAQSSSQTCVVLDPGFFAHAAPALADLRLFNGIVETPYVVRAAAPVETSRSSLDPLNLGTRDGQTSFDLAMPSGTYSDLELSVSAQNFIATVNVSGSQSENASAETRLGAFTIFDLSAQKLGRSTVLHLPPSDFRYLHFRITGSLKPDEIQSASISRDPVTQALYTLVAETSVVKQQQHISVITLTVPAEVPVDRVLFVPTDQTGNFTRDVTVEIQPGIKTQPQEDSAHGVEMLPSFSGNLLRLHRIADGRHIDEERLAVDVSNELGNEQTAWVITIENGDDPPLALKDVRLEMQQRELCFDAAPNSSYTLFYGDSSLQPPRYDYATLFAPQKNPAPATAGPEEPNPAYQPRPDDRPFTERHPALLWIALLAVMVVLGVVAVQSLSGPRPQDGNVR